MAVRDDLPGAALIEQGLADLASGVDTIEASLVLVGRPRLRDLGIDVPLGRPDPEHHLYEMLSVLFGADEAHSRYNALIRQLVSFERAAECVG